jgi:alpha-galactosidase
VLPLGAEASHFRGEGLSEQLSASQQERFRRCNYMGMNATDYGGGVPVIDVWTPKGGLAVGHLSRTPELVALPVRMQDGQMVQVQLVEPRARTLAPGDSLHGVQTFVHHHEGDYYSTLATYAVMMAAQGVEMPTFPETAYEPIWCAWGYSRNFKTENILATIPKVKELGLDWVVLDDGWQVAEGEWHPHPERFPSGDASMRAFFDHIHDAGLKAKLWWVPFATDPASQVDQQHPVWALLNEDGSHREITWWDAYYLCPAVPAVRSYTRDLIDRFINDWGYDGLKVDGQNLNAVPPCYNESHRHYRAEASVRAVPRYFQDVYDVATEGKSKAVVELCPCGDAASFHNMPFNNQPVASDPTSSWQIRSKGKTFKALMGPRTPYYGDHVELSDGGDDFASSVGIGAVVGTKFTWAPDSVVEVMSGKLCKELSVARLE